MVSTLKIYLKHKIVREEHQWIKVSLSSRRFKRGEKKCFGVRKKVFGGLFTVKRAIEKKLSSSRKVTFFLFFSAEMGQCR